MPDGANPNDERGRHLHVSPAGEVQFLDITQDGTDFTDTTWGAMHAVCDAEGWLSESLEREVVMNRIRIRDVISEEDETLHVWIDTPTSGVDAHYVASRHPDGTWSYADTQETSMDTIAVAFGPGVMPIQFSQAATSGTQRILASTSEGELLLSTPHGNLGWIKPVSSNGDGAVVEGASIAIAHSHGGGVELVWGSPGGMSQLATISDVPRLSHIRPIAPSDECPVISKPLNLPCPESCSATARGIYGESFAATRVDENRIVVAYAIAQRDMDFSYQEEYGGDGDYDPDDTIYCLPDLERDESTGELHVAEVNISTGEVIEHFVDMLGRAPSIVSVESRGPDVAIAVALERQENLTEAIRVLRVNDWPEPTGTP